MGIDANEIIEVLGVKYFVVQASRGAPFNDHMPKHLQLERVKE